MNDILTVSVCFVIIMIYGEVYAEDSPTNIDGVNCTSTDDNSVFCNITKSVTSDTILSHVIRVKHANLEKLELYCPDSTAIQWTNFNNLENLTNFIIQKCICRTINNTILRPDFKRLKSLEFTSINSEFLELIKLNQEVRLTSLVIDKSNLTTIPRFVLELNRSNMSKLYLRHNKIENISCDLFQGQPCLENTCYISLISNNIVSIPKCVCKAKLYTIYLDSNKLSDISNSGCIQQFHVSMPYNAIRELPTFTFRKVVTFDLTLNNIRLIKKETFQASQDCVTLSLSHNEIEWIEEGAFRGLKHVQFLYLDFNKLIKFDVIHAPVGSIFQVGVHLRNNQLRHPPYSSTNYSIPQLFKTTAHNNPYQCDCAMTVFVSRYLIDQERARVNPAPPSSLFVKSYQYITQVYIQATSYTCDSPHVMKKKRVLDLNATAPCRVLDACPQNCTCIRYQAYGPIYVNCSSAQLTDLPKTMPAGLLKINLQNNNISVLDIRDYWLKTVSLNLSNNHITMVDSSALTLLADVTFLDLRNNRLSALPRSLDDVSFEKHASIYLSGNEWKCSCDTIWMIEWLKRNRYLLLNDSNISCSELDNADDLLLVDGDTLGCNTNTSIIVLSSVLACFFVLIITSSLIAFKFRYEIRVLFYTRIKTRFQIPDPHKIYDAFISYSEHDREFALGLVNQLETNAKLPYKICIHDRDFLVGSLIAENISLAINTSSAVLCVVSEHFIESEWCSFEFQTAYQTMVEQQNTKVIIIKLSQVDEDKLQNELKAYFRTRCYIDANDKLFMDKLLYSLPSPVQDAADIQRSMVRNSISAEKFDTEDVVNFIQH